MRLSLENVTVTFDGVKALDDVSFVVESGGRVAVIGSSGAGKSTLFRVLSRGVPASGKVLIGDRDLYSLDRRQLTEVRRRIGTIRQAYDLVPQLSAGMNIALGEVGATGGSGSLGLFIRGPKSELASRVNDALDGVGLSDKARSRTSSLSGGQQQRVAVARLLVQRPEIVLADEPFSAVDPVTTKRVLDALLQLNREGGATLLVNLHDVELAKSFPRVLALKDGALVHDGSPEDLTDAKLGDIYAGDPARIRREEPENIPPAPVTGGMDGISAR